VEDEVRLVDIKTSTLEWIHYKKAKRMLDNRQGRVPILLLVGTEDNFCVVRRSEAKALLSRADAGDVAAQAALEAFRLMYFSNISAGHFWELYIKTRPKRKTAQFDSFIDFWRSRR
jgi:hypothetical protein